MYDPQEDGRLSAVAKVSLAAMAVAEKTSRAFVVFALSALLTLSVRAADLEPQQVSVGFGRFDMLIAIFVSLLVGFLAGRFCYRRSCPTAEKDALMGLPPQRPEPRCPCRPRVRGLAEGDRGEGDEADL